MAGFHRKPCDFSEMDIPQATRKMDKKTDRAAGRFFIRIGWKMFLKLFSSGTG
jgi:hypothetical protein